MDEIPVAIKFGRNFALDGYNLPELMIYKSNREKLLIYSLE